VSVEEKRERVGGWKVGVCNVHVLFVNHPTGKRDTWLYGSHTSQRYKARSSGRWRQSERYFYVYMYVDKRTVC